MANQPSFVFPFFFKRVGRIVHPDFREFIGGRSSGDVQDKGVEV